MMLCLRETSTHPQTVPGFRPHLAWLRFGKRNYTPESRDELMERVRAAIESVSPY